MTRDRVKIFSLLFLIFTPFAVVFAQAPAPITDINQVEGLLAQIVTWISTFFWILAIIIVFYSAFLFLASGGDEEKTKKGKMVLLYAIVAIAIALMAGGFAPLIRSILRSGGSAPGGTNPSGYPPNVPVGMCYDALSDQIVDCEQLYLGGGS
mgnify:CR=1 FL=1